MKKCPEQIFAPNNGNYETDPITGRHARFNPARKFRHSEVRGDSKALITERSDCFFCTNQTPSNLFFVDRDGHIVVPNEEKSFVAAEEYLRGKDTGKVETYCGLVRDLARYNAIDEPFYAKTFCNLTPALGRGGTVPLCLVTAIHQDYHYTQFHDLPSKLVEAVLRSWQFVERWAAEDNRDWVVVPFFNGGGRRESGQSVACCHGQLYLYDSVPPLFEQIRQRREQTGGCPLCQAPSRKEFENLTIWSGTTLSAYAHPAPKHSWSLLVAPNKHLSSLTQIDCFEFAEILQRCIRALRNLNNIEPAHNIVIRSGKAVGHLHAEIIPKSETTVPAGAEEASGEFIIDVLPQVVKQQLQDRA